MARERRAPAVPTTVQRFVKSLVVTAKAVTLYPPSSNIPLQTAESCAAILREVLQERSELRLVISKDGVWYGSDVLFPESQAYRAFAHELYLRRLAEVRFHAGTEPRDLVAFLSVLKYTPEEVQGAGGYEARLWEQGVGTITVAEAQVSLVDGADVGEPSAPALSKDELDEVLTAAYSGRARDQMTIARFAGDPLAVSGYLSAIATGEGEGLRLAGERLAQLAEIAHETAGGDERERVLRSLAEALARLEPEIRRDLLVEELLPEARTNEAAAELVRQLDLDEVCRMLVSELDETSVSQEGLARAIRTLAQISLADREEVAGAAQAALSAGGASAGFAAGVMESVAPSHITVREGPAPAAAPERPADAIFRLMDLAPTPQRASLEEDPDVAALALDARRGITDGDVIMALVSLVGYDARDQPFASTMAMLEDSLDLLIARGEIDIAADAADALNAAAVNTDLSAEQRQRMRRAVARLGKPEDVRAVAHALKLYEPGTPEHDSARRLLDALGALALEPLLEQLADEPDMTARKALVDLLSEMAPVHISELGAHVSDPRWYVVRNVVSALGSTRSSAVLPYIERTLHHHEARVRREALRALSAINDRVAHEMLILALGDEDAQNVQLAARYIGLAHVRTAVPALEQVARGEGRGNRENGPRVEAIEALGRLGATEALPTLESIAGRRSIVRSGRVRELRAAAENAIARIKAGGGSS